MQQKKWGSIVLMACLAVWGTGCVFLGDEFHDKRLISIACLAADNPTLRMDHIGSVDSKNRVAEVEYPDYADLSAVTLTVAYDGVGLRANGADVEGTKVTWNLAEPLTLSVVGLDDEGIDYTVAVERPPAATSHQLQEAAVTSPDSPDTWFGVTAAPFLIKVSSWFSYDFAGLYLHLRSTGAQILVDGVPWNPSQAETKLWDMTVAHRVTVVAEDLSEGDYEVAACLWQDPVFDLKTSSGVTLKRIGLYSSSTTWAAPAGTDLAHLKLERLDGGAPTTVAGHPIATAATLEVDFTQPVTVSVSTPLGPINFLLTVVVP